MIVYGIFLNLLTLWKPQIFVSYGDSLKILIRTFLSPISIRMEKQNDKSGLWRLWSSIQFLGIVLGTCLRPNMLRRRPTLETRWKYRERWVIRQSDCNVIRAREWTSDWCEIIIFWLPKLYYTSRQPGRLERSKTNVMFSSRRVEICLVACSTIPARKPSF